ncbi:MAG: lipocalin-like domain-containing protein [Acidobacteriota bacterium]
MKILIWSVLILLSNYRPALPGYTFHFPRDHGNHPEYKLEWWYYTGHLDSAEGAEFGYELTFFRTGMEKKHANASLWSIDDLYPAHFAISDLTGARFHFFEKLNRQGPGIAGAREGALDVWNQNWFARMEGNVIRLGAAADSIRLQLRLTSNKRPVVHGRGGVSRKSENGASHYYSLTRLATEGTLFYQGRTLEVRGESWMDHEFGSQQLGPRQVGWDWFSLQLDQGEELMVFQIRRRDGTIDPFSAATVISSSGEAMALAVKDFSLRPGRGWGSSRTGARYPVEWTIHIPRLEAELQVSALLDDQELLTFRSSGIAYWEGAIGVLGRWRGKRVQGRGYLEMTGYAKNSRPNI